MAYSSTPGCSNTGARVLGTGILLAGLSLDVVISGYSISCCMDMQLFCLARYDLAQS
jgi:hypothetical protein